MSPKYDFWAFQTAVCKLQAINRRTVSTCLVTLKVKLMPKIAKRGLGTKRASSFQYFATWNLAGCRRQKTHTGKTSPACTDRKKMSRRVVFLPEAFAAIPFHIPSADKSDVFDHKTIIMCLATRSPFAAMTNEHTRQNAAGLQQLLLLLQ